jgi:16S rRNA (guanine(527)-N(7))-methyltransferase RsmG
MDTPRTVALLAPFVMQSLSEKQLDQISIYIDLLKRWNARVNLTAIRNDEEIVTRHFGESFFMAAKLFARPEEISEATPEERSKPLNQESQQDCHPERSRAQSEAMGSTQSKDPYPSNAPYPIDKPAPRKLTQVVDIGSGAGFPALPLKLWAPEIHLTLIESNNKKATFLKEVARSLTLTNINVIPERLETIIAAGVPPHPDIVTLRAVERFETIVQQATKLLSPESILALLISTPQLPHLKTIQNMHWGHPIPVPGSKTRMLAVGLRE